MCVPVCLSVSTCGCVCPSVCPQCLAECVFVWGGAGSPFVPPPSHPEPEARPSLHKCPSARRSGGQAEESLKTKQLKTKIENGAQLGRVRGQAAL